MSRAAARVASRHAARPSAKEGGRGATTDASCAWRPWPSPGSSQADPGPVSDCWAHLRMVFQSTSAPRAGPAVGPMVGAEGGGAAGGAGATGGHENVAQCICPHLLQGAGGTPLKSNAWLPLTQSVCPPTCCTCPACARIGQWRARCPRPPHEKQTVPNPWPACCCKKPWYGVVTGSGCCWWAIWTVGADCLPWRLARGSSLMMRHVAVSSLLLDHCPVGSSIAVSLSAVASVVIHAYGKASATRFVDLCSGKRWDQALSHLLYLQLLCRQERDDLTHTAVLRGDVVTLSWVLVWL